MSEALVEAAFDGEIEEVQAQVDKGFHPESCDGHEQTALSEAACQGLSGTRAHTHPYGHMVLANISRQHYVKM